MKTRTFGVDLVRVIAIFLVISVHYFLNNNFYEINTVGISMFIANFLRWLAYSCVPLFMILTGYLMNKKELNKQYFYGITKVISIYIVSTILISLYIHFLKETNYSISNYIMNFFSFAYYGWYIEMYIALFLVIPFLNILYNNIATNDQKKLLIVILMLVTGLSSMFNQVKIEGHNFNFVIDYWDIAYPLTYYFIGAFINEYKLKINKYINLSLIFFLLYIETLITFLYYRGAPHNMTIFYGYGALPTVVISSLIFVLLYDLTTKSMIVTKTVTSIAKVSLSMYLLSYVVDNFVYGKIHSRVGLFDNGFQILKYLPIILIIFIGTYILASIVEGILNIVKESCFKERR